MRRFRQARRGPGGISALKLGCWRPLSLSTDPRVDWDLRVEQLSGQVVQKLLEGTRQAAQPGIAGVIPDADDIVAGIGADGRRWIDPAPAAGRGNQAALAIRTAADSAFHQSVERRVVRRAEALWRRLAGERSLPAAASVGELLHLAIRGKALLLQNHADSPSQLVFVGEHLMNLTGLAAGQLSRVRQECNALGESLVALAEQAIRTATLCWFESGGEGGQHRDNSRADNRDSNLQLLMRAVALPFAARGSTTQAGSAVVVASWRRLLSREETRALHRELRAAMDWIQNQSGGR